MHESLSRLHELLDGYLRDSCTDDEEQELLTIIRQGSHGEHIRDFIQTWVDSNASAEQDMLTPGRSEEIFNNVIMADARLPATRMFSWRKVAAAAAIVIGFAAGTYLLVRQNTEPAAHVVAQVPLGEDISPGKSGAILILGDGSKVVLDSSQNGTITMQGNAAVDIENGVVSYELVGTDTAVVFNTMTTPRGRKYRLVLADGSVIWLNSESAVTFPTSFPGNERVVTIEGEAYFEVARHIDKPFIVKTGDRQEIRVLGTQFNINAYENESVIKTTLIKGSIQVEARSGETVVLQPGQQATVAEFGSIKTRNNTDLEEVVAWKKGFFHFQNADIKTVMRQLSRWYDVEVSYPATLPDWSFTGEIGETLTLKEVLDGLAFTNIKFKIDGRKLILLPQ